MVNDFKVDYINRYEDILSKTAVAKVSVANFRFESNLTYGDTVIRAVLDLSGVRVRSFSNLADRTIDPVTDSEESMLVNYQFGAVFPMSRVEKIQAGPLSPGERAGKEIAIKVNNFFDAAIFAETRNAYADFDTGDLTGAGSNSTPFVLNGTTVPQFVTMTDAKLRTNNVSMANTLFVLDPVSVGLIAQYPIGKDITSANTTFTNGLKGDIYGSKIYMSNNLTGEAVLTSAGAFVDTQTVTIGGVVATSMTTLGTTAGNFLIGADQTASHANLAGLLNAPGTTSSTQVAFSAADQIKIVDILGIGSSRHNGVAVTATGTTNVIVGIGSSRLSVSETQTNASWTKNFIHCYFGMGAAIDVAMQDKPDMEMRDEPKQRTTNIFNDIVGAIKTFADGSQKFLDVHISIA